MGTSSLKLAVFFCQTVNPNKIDDTERVQDLQKAAQMSMVQPGGTAYPSPSSEQVLAVENGLKQVTISKRIGQKNVKN